MENFNPLDHIPDKWLEKSRCPVCSTAPLLIDHQEWEPDRFFCPGCELCFQVAKNSPSIFVLQDPLDYDTGYVGEWVEMKTLIENSRSRKHNLKSESPVQSGSPVEAQKNDVDVDHEVTVEEKLDPIYEKYPENIIDSAISLYEMGNSRQSIKNILSRNSQLSEGDIDEIIYYVTHQKRKKEPGSRKIPRWAIGCILVPALCIISYLCMMLYFQLSFANQLAASPNAVDITVIDFEKLPGFIRNVIPEDVQNTQMPKAIVTKYASTNMPQAACPTSVQGAVSLFGGQAEDWEKGSGQVSWNLQTNYLRTLNLPEGYVAVMPYLDHGLAIQITVGPARIQNAYLVAISCP